MKALILKDFQQTEANRYLGDTYPGPGLYQAGADLIVVYRSAAVLCTAIVNGGAVLLEEVSLPVEVVAAPEPRGVSEDFVLRALAIAQQPTLAPSLLGVKSC